MDETREPQYQNCVEIRDQFGLTPLGLMSNQTWRDDPRRLLFVMSRYKFVSKMLSGLGSVLEVGCADAFGTRIVLQEVDSVTAVDFDPVFVRDVNDRQDAKWPIECREHDILDGPVEGPFDASYSLDVIEHITPADEDRFVSHMAQSVSAEGVVIIGSPSLESQQHASPPSKAGHVNCKSGVEFKELMQRHFHNVFLFSMNDEVVHTGYAPMAHYLLTVSCQKKSNS